MREEIAGSQVGLGVTGWSLLLCLSACAPSERPGTGEGEGSESARTEAEQPVSRPADRSDPGATAATETISIEGTPQPIAVRAVQPPPAFPLAFVTVVPQDMRVDFVSTGEGDAVRFEAEFGGVHNPEALLSLTVLPDGSSVEEAREWISELAGGNPRRRESTEQAAWIVESYTLRGERSGFVALGEREGRWFYFLASYPPEYGDGMGPRIDLILSRWKWADGSALGTAGSG